MNRTTIALAAFAAALAGCTTLSPDGGLERVEALAKPRVKQDLAPAKGRDAQALVRDRLARPVGADDAVAIALLNNPGLKAAYSQLGIDEAAFVQAGRLPNIGFSYTRLRAGEEREIERKFTFDLLTLLLLPLRQGADREMYAAAQERTALEVVRLAEAARRAWIDAVAAAELARYAAQVADAAAAGEDLARQMGRAGNWSRLAQAREQLFHAEAAAALARARHAEIAARERLVRVLGLSGEDALRLALPERLPDLPAAGRELADAEGVALSHRLDVSMARRETEATAKSLGLVRATRFVNVLHLGYERNGSSFNTPAGNFYPPRQTGYEVALEIPIFDWGEARAARAEATYMQSVHLLAQAAIRARSEVREFHSAYRTTLEIARRHREDIVPMRKRISEENLLRYNGMQIGVFELLADARGQVASVMAAIEATRDFWVADANLETALMTGSPAGTLALKSSTMPAADAGGH